MNARSPRSEATIGVFALCLVVAGIARGAELAIELATPSEEVLLGSQSAIDVSITARSAGQGVSGLMLLLDASRGELGGLRDLGGGRYQATYRLPKERHPQAILLAAWAPGAVPGFTVLKLRTSVDLPVNTSKPRVTVKLRLARREFGPVLSDDRGQAKIPLLVGPDETRATVIGVDEFGNTTRRTVTIPIPQAPRLCAFADRKSLAADGEDAATIFLVAIEPDGTPAQTIELAGGPPQGHLGEPTRLRPGLFTVRYKGPATLTARTALLSVALRTEPELSQRSFTFDLGAGRPASARLAAEPEALTADGASNAKLTVTIADKAGNLLPGLTPTIRCTLGVSKPLTDLGDGRYLSEVVAPAYGAPSLTCTAELAQSSGAPIRASAQIQLTPPQIGRFDLQAENESLPMDGKATTRIAVSLSDRRGNPIPGFQIKAQAPLGGLDPVSDDGGGRYHFTYTAPRGEHDTKVRISISARKPDDGQTIEESLVIALQGVAPPTPELPWVSIGPSGAFMTNFRRLLFGGASLEVGFRIPGLKGYLHLLVESGYRYSQSTETVDLGSARLDLGVAPLHFALVFKPMPRSLATPLLVIGGGAEFVQWSLRGPLGGVEGQRSILPGALGGIGAEMRLGIGLIVVWVRYVYADLDARTPAAQQGTGQGGSIAVGQVGGLDASVGYRLVF